MATQNGHGNTEALERYREGMRLAIPIDEVDDGENLVCPVCRKPFRQLWAILRGKQTVMRCWADRGR